MCCHRCYPPHDLFMNPIHCKMHKASLFLTRLFCFLLQWGFHDNRSILGYQSGPARFIYAFLAPQSRRRRQHSKRREPPVRVHHTHRLPSQVQQNFCVLWLKPTIHVYILVSGKSIMCVGLCVLYLCKLAYIIRIIFSSI